MTLKDLSSQDIINIINLYNNKNSIIKLSKTYKCHQRIIRKVLENNNIHIRGISESIATTYISDDKRNEIENLYLSGKSIRDIAKIYNADRTFIRLFMIRNKINIRQTSINRYDFLLQNKDKIINLYNEHGTLQYISDFYNINKTTISEFLDKQGIKYQKNGSIENIPIEDKDKISKLYKEGKSLGDIAVTYNVTNPTITRYFKNNNMEIRNPIDGRIMVNKHYNYKLPSGKIVIIQGYEPNFLNYVFNNKILKENQIKIKPKYIIYLHNNKPHRYYPDFYIPKYNLIVEVKLQKDNFLLKKQAVLDNGFNFLLVLDNDFKPFDNYILNENTKTTSKI
jgi:intein-encoded DNA endonuclease-like protein